MLGCGSSLARGLQAFVGLYGTVLSTSGVACGYSGFLPFYVGYWFQSINNNNRKKERNCLFVGWLLNVPATGECISGTDLLRQFYVLPHLR